jgi:GDP-4-dehydro-6-deoxy-D-mannose reductase
MKSILITGISGFVGGYYSRYLANTKKNVTIHGISRSKPSWDFIDNRDELLNAIHFHQCDLLDASRLNTILKEIQPDYILHLASFSSVAESWKKPQISFLNNTNAFLNIVEGVRNQNFNCKIISVGSSEEYGIVKDTDLPIPEIHPLSPVNPYAVARVSEEYLAQIYSKGYQFNICTTRSFNHIGPGQKENFVISSIAKQFANISVNNLNPVITIGDGSIIRDFTDVRDVIVAYDSIFEKGLPGETYNVCSGKGYSIFEIVSFLSELSDISVTIECQKDLLRPVDNPVLIGDNSKILSRTRWKPKITLRTSLNDIFDYWVRHMSYP